MSAQLHTRQTDGTTLVPPNEHGQSFGDIGVGRDGLDPGGAEHDGEGRHRPERRDSGLRQLACSDGATLRLVRPDDADGEHTGTSAPYLLSSVPGATGLLPEGRRSGTEPLPPTDRAQRRLDVRRKRSHARAFRRRQGALLDREAGMATAEYAIATLAAVGFAALLVAVLSSGEVRGLLMSLITSALNFG